jgi:hypothetical protein
LNSEVAQAGRQPYVSNALFEHRNELIRHLLI